MVCESDREADGFNEYVRIVVVSGQEFGETVGIGLRDFVRRND
jgi:hypothetical protein